MSRRAVFIMITAAVLLGAGAWCVCLMMKPAGDTVIISQDGKELYRLDMGREPDRIIEVEYEGRRNVIEIKNGKIFMAEADCPDHICVETGKLRADTPIVCLPNRLVIEYEERGLDGTAR